MFMEWIGDIGALLFMAIALSMDSFSFSLSIGLQFIRLKRIFIIGLVFGAFHVLLPFVGVVVGQFISLKLEHITTFISGIILVFIGSYMVFSAFQTKTYVINPKGIKLLSVGFLVSVDSFPVGISLGLSGFKTIIVILLFGVAATILSWLGMLIGRKVHSVVGTYSEMVGGIILFIFGLNAIF